MPQIPDYTLLDLEIQMTKYDIIIHKQTSKQHLKRNANLIHLFLSIIHFQRCRSWG